MSELKKEIIALVTRAVVKGFSVAELRKDLDVLLKKYGRALTSDLEAFAMRSFKWLGERSISVDARKDLVKLFDEVDQGYARARGKIRENVVVIFKDAVRNGKSPDETKSAIEKEIGTFRNYAETIRRTGKSAFSEAAKFEKARVAEMKKFTYAGPPAERPFCQKMLEDAAAGKKWTEKEIEKMDNGQGLPVKYYKGGYNCRHYFQPVE